MPSTPFHHAALLYDDEASFLAGAVPFVREGIARGEPILVALEAPKLAVLEQALGDDAGAVRFEDVERFGANPARLIPGWQAFVEDHAAADGRARALGEPIWAGRSPEEVVECQLHEALLNRSVVRAEGSSLLCAYDTGALAPPVLREACCSHPFVVAGERRHRSPIYRGDDAVPPAAEAPLSPPPPDAQVLGFDVRSLEEVRVVAAACAHGAGLDEVARGDLVLTVHELAVNSVRHSGGIGVLRAWAEDGTAVCEVRDGGRLTDPMAGRRRPRADQLGGWGLWLANQLSDLVQVRSGADGTVVRVRRAA